MPCYDYRCDACDIMWEGYNTIDERHSEKCPNCRQNAQLTISATRTKPVIMDYFDEHLDARITGPRQRKRIMDEKNLMEKD